MICNVVNMTPHPIALVDESGSTRIIPRAGPVVRVVCTPGEVEDSCMGVPIMSAETYEGLHDLPDERAGTVLVVSRLSALFVAATMPWRRDVVYPDSRTGTRRDRIGVLSVRALVRAN